MSFRVRAARQEDCTDIQRMIMELAVYGKMADQVKISHEGVLYLDKCPRQPLIPIYLIVQGVFALVLVLLSCLPCTQEGENGGGAISTFCTTWNSLITLFLFCWSIAGNVWVYSIYEPNYDPMTPLYCAKTLYLFTFWIITLVYIIIGLGLIAGCCIMVCMCVCGRAGLSSGISDDV